MNGQAQARGFARFAYACQFFFGGWFLFHGLNYWCAFFVDRSLRPGPGLIPALVDAGVMDIVKVLEVIIGAALLADLFTALAIVAAWPLTLMIAFVNASHLRFFGIAVGAIIVGLNLLMSLGHLDRYRAMLVRHAGPPSFTGGLTGSLAGAREMPIGNPTRLPMTLHVVGIAFGVIAPVLVTYWTLRR